MENVFAVGPAPRTVQNSAGDILTVPADWELLAPGDAMLTRRVKAAGDFWVVQEKRGRKMFSQGIWAPAATIANLKVECDAARSTDGYAKRKQADAKRRERAQAEYVEDFEVAVLKYLAFHQAYETIARQMAKAIALHATPVGSGTVARTTRIPIEQRAESAVIAWMRHQTTGYDSMQIARIKGERREVRRMLAQRSKQLLNNYRAGLAIKADCPLQAALSKQA